MCPVSEKEIIVLDRIARNSAISQRKLAENTGLSLGLINFILKKFIQVGYLLASPHDKRKMKYTLTSEGLAATVRQTSLRISEVVRNYRQIRSDLDCLMKELVSSGYRYFSIHGDGELRELVTSTFKQCIQEGMATLGEEHRQDEKSVVLNMTPEAFTRGHQGQVVNVLEKIGSLSQ